MTDTNLELASQILPFTKKVLKDPQYSDNAALGYNSTYAKADNLSKLEEFQPVIDYFAACGERFINELGYKFRFNRERIFLVASSMREGDYHERHPHPMSMISGVFYLQAPEGSSPIRIHDPREFQKILQFSITEPKPTNLRTIEFEAKAGELILFESWLEHSVPKNKSKKDRIALVFNYST